MLEITSFSLTCQLLKNVCMVQKNVLRYQRVVVTTTTAEGEYSSSTTHRLLVGFTAGKLLDDCPHRTSHKYLKYATINCYILCIGHTQII